MLLIDPQGRERRHDCTDVADCRDSCRGVARESHPHTVGYPDQRESWPTDGGWGASERPIRQPHINRGAQFQYGRDRNGAPEPVGFSEKLFVTVHN